MDLIAHAIFEILMTPRNFYFQYLTWSETQKKSEISQLIKSLTYIGPTGRYIVLFIYTKSPFLNVGQ